MMTVEEQNLAHRAVNALEDIAQAVTGLRKDLSDAQNKCVLTPKRFEVCHSSFLTRFGGGEVGGIHEEKWRAFLLLLDAIDAVYLKKDGTYGDLASVVSDKVQYIKSLFPKEQ